jgi:hypothetical protein
VLFAFLKLLGLLAALFKRLRHLGVIMKKNLLSLAVAAGAAGMTSVASAQMYLNSEGTGEALIFPFYSVQSGNDTYIHVVNTTAQTKAVKVRMIESVDSLETLDFNLYLSPQDHFAFVITVDGEGAMMKTADNSCTVPAIPEAGQPFSTLLWADDPATDATDRTAEENREQVGYVEVIEMGQIVDGSDTAADILHATAGDTIGMPADCAQLVTNWSNTGGTEGAWYAEADAELVGTVGGGASVGTTDFAAVWNGGGLYGVATVINVAEGTAFGYEARAIEDLVEAGSTGSVLHYPPGDTRPDFNDNAMANTANVNVDGVQTVYTGQLGVNHGPVSAVFMTGSISNDYVVDPDLNALTDWVINFPTKSSHLDAAGDLSAPFSNTTTAAGTDLTALCQPVSVVGYDREELTQDPPTPGSDGPAFSPSTRPETTATPDLLICNEVTVAHFGSASATNTTADIANGLANVSAYVDGWDAGWAVMDFESANLNNVVDNDRELAGAVADAEGLLAGLPVTGFAVVEYTNGVADANVRNYQQAWDHKTNVVTSD